MASFAIPQDDYFEWEDIITDDYVPTLQHFTSKHPDYFHVSNSDNYQIKSTEFEKSSHKSFPYDDHQFHWVHPSESRLPTVDSTRELSSKTLSKPEVCVIEKKPTQKCPARNTSNVSCEIETRDDSGLKPQPVRNVDYLSFPWHQCESDLWASHKYLRVTRKQHSQEHTYKRLKNACWRAVAVGRLNLDPVDPQKLNWYKDQDDTWLHGPFVESPSFKNSLPPTVRVPLSESQNELDERPIASILKQSSPTALLLRGSITTSEIRPSRPIHTRQATARKLRQRLRFAAEVKQYMSLPSEITEPETGRPLIGMSPTRTVYQLPSGRLREEHISEEVDALRSALQDVVATRPLENSYRSNLMGSKQDYASEVKIRQYSFSSDWVCLGGLNVGEGTNQTPIDDDEINWILTTSEQDYVNPWNSIPSSGLAANDRGIPSLNGTSANIFPKVSPGLQSPPELFDSSSGSVSEDDFDEVMEEFNLILG
ncbi:BgTH12-05960 [Blumeria graminis f. sp. triticale]|uniref:Bgt-2567 n=3 Tax=Blumeria graminis TaxID=34373 RepID=A0A9X9QEU3_BLUGR|nr:BgTH12-05960 [Blumeria graminis f. sp. triticale]VDB91043.1 Bgt-2567 [Blumeria graminis f. sp. tritici]